jgi:hypothetical protein
MAVRYALYAPAEKIFSFSLSSGEDMDLFTRAGEGYLLNHLERSFDSLDLYYSILSGKLLNIRNTYLQHLNLIK